MVTDASNSYQILIKSFARLGQTEGLIGYLDKYIEIQQETVYKRKADRRRKIFLGIVRRTLRPHCHLSQIDMKSRTHAPITEHAAHA